MKKPIKRDPALAKRLAQIAAPYKACAKKLGLDYSNHKKWTWATRTKVRNCVMTILRKRRSQ